MNLNKLVLLPILPFLFAFQKDSKQTKIFYDEHYEVLNGRVKQIVTSGLDLMGTPFLIEYSDTTLFDRRGGVTELRFYRRGDFHDVKIFQNIPKGKAYTVENPSLGGIGKTVTQYDNTGRVIQELAYNNIGLFEKKVYAYDARDQVIEVRTYDEKNALLHKIVFLYNNNNGLLIERDYFEKDHERFDFRALFQYNSFDKMNNWMKRIKIEKSSGDNGRSFADTVTRKITYY